MSPRITLADVAERAGVSRTAASLILNGRENTRLSVDARRRVFEAAEALNYRPNLMARGLRMDKSATIGFVSDRIASTRYAGPMIRGALRAARERDHTLFVTETEGDLREQELAIEALLDRQVDALILATVTGTIMMPERQLPVPLVVLNGSAGPGEYHSVLPDEKSGGRQAASHLIDLGHRRVHILGTSEPEYWTVPVRRRIESLLSEFSKGGVEVVQVALDRPVWDFETGLDTATRAVAKHGPVTAAIALNDTLAAGAYEGFRQAGLVIPDDVSIVSFDDDDIVSVLRPHLTTVALPFEAMGRRAVELALDQTATVGEHLEQMHLRHRDSTRRAITPVV
ncbi:LacI family DNA-binding transcriptional regulator [Paenarthrobacter nitroguajacolicus]|uniref:LacI family DNA-binding transcriptional regulator n=1 Tax=Paenarthrobacter nitroguajacolicus TaxID=211146 RepID=UPI0014151D63|nr:LacI family DNA-binding transcriptional regulator [Paenarthrobacter nitroguajacolicus]